MIKELINLIGKDFIVKFAAGFSSISLIRWYYITVDSDGNVSTQLVKLTD